MEKISVMFVDVQNTICTILIVRRPIMLILRKSVIYFRFKVQTFVLSFQLSISLHSYNFFGLTEFALFQVTFKPQTFYKVGSYISCSKICGTSYRVSCK